MYGLYKNQFRTGLLQFLTGLFVMITADLLIYHYRADVGIIGTIFCILLWNMVCILLMNVGYHKITASPYQNVKKCCLQEPGLSEILEGEFAQAENIENKVWIGEKYVFFKEDYEFKAFPKAEICDLNKRSMSIPRGSIIYMLTGKCGECHFTVSLSEKGIEYICQKLYGSV